MPKETDTVYEDSVEAELAAGESLRDVVGDDNLPSIITANCDYAFAYVNDGAGGVPAPYEAQLEAADDFPDSSPTWDPQGKPGAPQIADDDVELSIEPVPWATRADVTNITSGTASYRVRLVSVME